MKFVATRDTRRSESKSHESEVWFENAEAFVFQNPIRSSCMVFPGGCVACNGTTDLKDIFLAPEEAIPHAARCLSPRVCTINP